MLPCHQCRVAQPYGKARPLSIRNGSSTAFSLRCFEPPRPVSKSMGLRSQNDIAISKVQAFTTIGRLMVRLCCALGSHFKAGMHWHPCFGTASRGCAVRIRANNARSLEKHVSMSTSCFSGFPDAMQHVSGTISES